MEESSKIETGPEDSQIKESTKSPTIEKIEKELNDVPAETKKLKDIIYKLVNDLWLNEEDREIIDKIVEKKEAKHYG